MSDNSGFTPADWLAVNQLMARYVDAADRHDADQMASCWTSDGLFTAIPAKEVRTRDAIVQHEVELWKKAVADGKRRRHCITSILILTSSSVKVTTRVGMALTNMSDDGARIEMTYSSEDEIVKEAGEWRYAVRRLVRD